MKENPSKISNFKRSSFILLLICRIILLFFPITMMLYVLCFAIFKVDNFLTFIGSMLISNIIIDLYENLHTEEVLYIKDLEDNQKSKN